MCIADFILYGLYGFGMDLPGKKATNHTPRHSHHCHGLISSLISVKVQP